MVFITAVEILTKPLWGPHRIRLLSVRTGAGGVGSHQISVFLLHILEEKEGRCLETWPRQTVISAQ